MTFECTCATSVETYDGPDPECPEHGMCAAAGHPTEGGPDCLCGLVTPLTLLTSAYPELPEIPTVTNKKPFMFTSAKVLNESGEWVELGSGKITMPPMVDMEIVHHTGSPAPNPKPDPIAEQTVSGNVPWDQPSANPLADLNAAIQKAKATQVTVKPSGPWQSGSEPEIKPTPPVPGFPMPKKTVVYLLPGEVAYYTDVDGNAGQQANFSDVGVSTVVPGHVTKIVKAAVDTPPVQEDPATAPCRTFWGSHACDKPRIHVLPGHPAGPEHQCGWDVGQHTEPCSKVSADGTQLWVWVYETETWLLGAPPKLTGEDAP